MFAFVEEVQQENENERHSQEGDRWKDGRAVKATVCVREGLEVVVRTTVFDARHQIVPAHWQHCRIVIH